MSERMRTALVVEGGGMRGIFSAGVLDAFADVGFDPFDLYVGVSAGACNLSSFVAGQRGRNRRIYTRLMVRPEFMRLGRFLRGGHFMDLDWLWDAFRREDPLDVEAASRAVRGKGFVAVCTSVETGLPRYLEPSARDWLAVLKASSSIPLLYRGFTEVDGELLADGGVSDPIPAAEAWRRGARRIVIVRSRPEEYAKREGMEQLAAGLFLRRHPGLLRAIRGTAAAYRESTAWMAAPPAGAEVRQIAPPETMKTGRTTRDLSLLQADYESGLACGREFAASFRRNAA